MKRILAFLSALISLYGQQSGGDSLAAGMAANAKLLQQYTYKTRTEIKFKGEARFVSINQVRFGADGKPQATLVSQSNGGKAPPSGIAKQLIEQKTQELKDYGARMTTLVENYFPIDPQKLALALARAELGGSGNTISLVVKDYYKSGDSMSVIFDPDAKKLRKFELKTLLDQDPMSVTADMATLPKGPIYPSFIKVKAPAKDLEIDISEYDFVKASAP